MDVDATVIQRHRRCAPLYDTYPGAEWFVEAFDSTALDAALMAATAMGSPRMAIDLRLPAAGPHWSTRALAEWPQNLQHELDAYVARLPRRPVIEELRLSWSDTAGIDADALMRLLERSVDIDPGAHLSVAIDVTNKLTARATAKLPTKLPAQAPTQAAPRTTTQTTTPSTMLATASATASAATPPWRTLEATMGTRQTSSCPTLGALHARGFSRVEFGTDAHIPRWRTAEERIRANVEQAHAVGFTSIGALFTYGAPGQMLRDVKQGLADLMACGPTHIALCNATDSGRQFRPVLDRSRSDRSTIETIRMLVAAVEMLTAAGYECIGQDLYARPYDPLATAHRQGRLLKKPHGLSIRPVSVVLAIGPGAIGSTGNAYYQNYIGASEYRVALARGELPVMRGAFLDAADLARRAVIHALIADMFVDIAAIEATHRIDFRRCFADELASLAELEHAGLLLFDEAMIELTLAGRLIAGSVAMIFDRPLTEARTRMPFQGRL